ncbi:MAG TPA: hypothetical protein VGL75_06865, partial [Acidothermaceae bacterium]
MVIAELPAKLSDYPTVLAYVEDGVAFIACPYSCASQFHEHSIGDGHRVAHCIERHEAGRGYVLVMTDAPMPDDLGRLIDNPPRVLLDGNGDVISD